jgi:hypothetical protein
MVGPTSVLQSTLLAVLALLVPPGPGLQEPGRPNPRPNEDPRRFDNDTLIRTWVRNEALSGPIPKEPRPASPPPIRPTDFLVVDAAGPEEQAWPAFITRYVLDPGSSVPVEGSVAPWGEAKWHRAKMPAQGELKGEFCFAASVIHADQHGVWMARLPGASALFVNGEGFVGDPERRGYLGVPVELRAGDNSVLVAGIEGGFELEFWKPPARIVMGTWDLAHPFLYRGCATDFGLELEMPLFNASVETVGYLHYHYGHAQCDDGSLVPVLTDWRDGGYLAPLGMIIKASYLFGTRDVDAGSECEHFLVPITAQDQNDADADRRVIELSEGSARERAGIAPSWSDLGLDAWTILVYGTMGSTEYQATTLALTRYYQQRLWYRSNICLRILPDTVFMNPDPEIDESQGTAIVFGDSSVNAVIGRPWAPATQPSSDGPPILKVTAPPRMGPKRARPPFGVFSAPDARTLRLLYAVDPFFSLQPGVREAAFAAGHAPAGGIVRRW